MVGLFHSSAGSLLHLFSWREHGQFCEAGQTCLRILGVLGALYAFLFGLDLMGVAFKATPSTVLLLYLRR